MLEALPRIFMMPRVQTGRLRNAIATVAVATVVVAGAALVPGGPIISSSPSGTDIWVATNGNDSTCVRGNQALPCLSLDRARDIAQCGDEVDIGTGTYGAQTIAGAPNNCASNPVLFSVASGTATFSAITMNTTGVRLTAIRTTSRMSIDGSCNGCQLYNSTLPAFDTNGPDNTEIVGNNIGPLDNQPDCNYGQSFMMPAAGSPINATTGFLIQGNTFHDFYCPVDPTNHHSEAIFLGAYTNHGYIIGNTWRSNGNTSHLFFTWCDTSNDDCTSWGGGYKDPHDICVRQNTWLDTYDAYFAINGRDELAGNPNLNIWVQTQTVTGPVIPPVSGNGGLADYMYPPTEFMLVSDCTDPR